MEPLFLRYNVDEQKLMQLIQEYVHDAFARTKVFLTDEDAAAQLCHDTGHSELSSMDVLSMSMQAALLQMFAFASEFSRRWTLPDLLAVAQEEIAKMAGERNG